MPYEITLVGAIGDQSIYASHDVNQLLEQEQTKLVHGETFTGRPCTQVHISTKHVVKVHNEIKLSLFSAKRWVQQALEKERKYQIHHPKKTWFVAHQIGKDTALVGNICPRLQPVHQYFNENHSNLDLCLKVLQKIFNYYFYMAKTFDLRIDEGFSNFGLDKDGDVYYLDDDVYMWDRFNSCAHMLGVYFRSSEWLNTEEAASRFGHIIHDTIYKQYRDKQYFTVLAELLKDVYFPSDKHRQTVQTFIEALQQKTTKQVEKIDYQNTRYLAILADIHANLPALEAVLDFLKQQNVTHGIVAGDIVGYGPHPTACIERLQATNFEIVKGNHDHGLATGQFEKGFSSTAKWVLDWTYQRVSAEHKTWLEELPPILYDNNWLVLHGSPIDPTFFNAYVYEMTYQENLNALERKQIPICFHGHTHQPGAYIRKGRLDKHVTDEVVDLSKVNHALVCPGSIGQPRNGQSGAQFAIYDQQEKKVYFHRLLYSVDQTIHDMETHAFPDPLINLLRGYGRNM
ncbi:metallophosphoesterase family protein [Candidatus Albibeggiatoa sp. nov. NOAA]|uniref:metallophosphoesterase family protein n=1 Tax=Candidatus Albibeggiatoa sp. nov. NOAA TaxID=3162724 RepID=UPI0032F2CCBF|nr:metallophosphatase family protein [Thiotrichaceae bacterium]